MSDDDDYELKRVYLHPTRIMAHIFMLVMLVVPLGWGGLGGFILWILFENTADIFDNFEEVKKK